MQPNVWLTTHVLLYLIWAQVYNSLIFSFLSNYNRLKSSGYFFNGKTIAHQMYKIILQLSILGARLVRQFNSQPIQYVLMPNVLPFFFR